MKNIRKTNLYLICLSLLLFSCGGQEVTNAEQPQQDWESQKEEIRKQALDFVHSYEAAIRTLDGEKLIDHYLESPEFAIVEDGQIKGYQEFTEEIRGLIPNLSKIEVELESVEVRVYGADVANALISFTETFIDKEGNSTPVSGDVTWTMVKKDEQWKRGYAHVIHDPVSEAN